MVAGEPFGLQRGAQRPIEVADRVDLLLREAGHPRAGGKRDRLVGLLDAHEHVLDHVERERLQRHLEFPTVAVADVERQAARIGGDETLAVGVGLAADRIEHVGGERHVLHALKDDALDQLGDRPVGSRLERVERRQVWRNGRVLELDRVLQRIAGVLDRIERHGAYEQHGCISAGGGIKACGGRSDARSGGDDWSGSVCRIDLASVGFPRRRPGDRLGTVSRG
jgi:hypothetical protein